jgi:hypothetical protein
MKLRHLSLSLFLLFISLVNVSSGFGQTSTSSAQSGKKTARAAAKGRQATLPPRRVIMWVNHFDLLPGDPSVTTSFNANSSGVGSGFTGLVIQSSTTGEEAQGGGIKVVHMGLEVPPRYLVRGVRVCYELSNKRSFISQIRLAQTQTPPSRAILKLDDTTDLTNPGPVCVDGPPTIADPSLGEMLMHVRVNFGDTSDKIVIRSVGLYLSPM